MGRPSRNYYESNAKFGRLAPNVFLAQGFSGHGVALTGLAGKLMAEVISGTAERFDVMSRVPHLPFPGGPFLECPHCFWEQLGIVYGIF